MFALLGARALAQELMPTPDPISAAPPGAGVNAGAPSPSSPATNAAAPAADQWRYRWFDHRWWYWTPQNRWLWYSNNGQWVEFDASHSPPAAAGSGYSSGNYPGVAVAARAYGNAHVAVGQRIGVDTAGGHGAVRVGRIFVGW
jgi:hypothetical protein